MTGFAGMDRDRFPGLTTMQNLLNTTNLIWTGYYLTPAPSQGHNLGWMGNRAALVNMGWGLAPVYVGQQDPAIGGNNSTNLTAAQGAADAQDAVNLAAGEGFPAGSVIYLDIEIGGPLSQANLDYIGAWIQGVFNLGYTAGAYGNASSHVTDQVHALDSRVILWGINLNKYSCNQHSSSPFPIPAPGDCGFADASLWQLLQNCVLKDANGNTMRDDQGAPLNADLDVAIAVDPSSIATPPSLTVPVVMSVSPISGSAAGGDDITITGSGFTNATGIGFGNTNAANASIDSDGQITAVSPPGNGTVDIQIITAGGTSQVTPNDQFTYI